MDITETYYPKNRHEWREWLTKNHAKKSEIWVIYFKKHTGKPTLAYQDAVDEALCFGWIDGIEKRMEEERFAGRFTLRREKSNLSENNVKRYAMLIELGLMTEAGTNAFNKKTTLHPTKNVSNLKSAA